MSKFIAHLRTQWMGALALFLAIAGGTAYAANTIGSADIIDDSIRSVDLKNGQTRSADLGNDTVQSIDIRDDTLSNGGLTAADLQAGSVGTDELTASALGARAFGLVRGATCADPPAFCTILRGKHVAYAAHVGDGKFCIGVNGTNATDPTALALVDQAFPVDDNWVYWRGTVGANSACVGSEFEIYTGQQATGLGDDDFTILIP